jgi:hypothetical protein
MSQFYLANWVPYYHSEDHAGFQNANGVATHLQRGIMGKAQLQLTNGVIEPQAARWPARPYWSVAFQVQTETGQHWENCENIEFRKERTESQPMLVRLDPMWPARHVAEYGTWKSVHSLHLTLRIEGFLVACWEAARAKVIANDLDLFIRFDYMAPKPFQGPRFRFTSHNVYVKALYQGASMETLYIISHQGRTEFVLPTPRPTEASKQFQQRYQDFLISWLHMPQSGFMSEGGNIYLIH